MNLKEFAPAFLFYDLMKRNAKKSQMNMAELAVLFAPPEGSEHTGLMFALPVPDEVASQLALKGGEKPESLHVTLAYCGNVSELSDEAIAAAVMCAKSVSQSWQPLKGNIGGIGRFNASDSSDGKDVIYASVDVPGLESMRERLVSHLREVGCPPLDNHGFTPHITLTYIEQGSKSPIERLETIPVEFSGLLLALGDKSSVYPLETPDHYPEMDYADGTSFPVNVQYTELTTDLLATDKAFDGLVAGEFTDMHGRSVKITRENLAAIVQNTTSLLETTRTESGELAGLPIDELQHNKGHASGWIVGVELVGDVLRIIPQWTELGRDLITKKIQRYFSATVDLAKQVLYGGTLTNWPATRDNKTGRVLLRPIELSEQATAENETPAPIETPNMEKQIMLELTEQELSAKITEAVTAALAAQPKPEPVSNTLDFSKMVDALDLSTDEAESQNISHLRELAKLMQEKANLHWKNILAEQQRENRYTELATKVTGGTTEFPRALPVTADALKNALLKLPADQAGFWMDLCQNVVKSGLTEFSEYGHSKEIKGVQALPADIARDLDNGTLTLADLTSPLLAPALGDLSAYNLSKWSK